MEDAMNLATHPAVWIFCLLIIAVVAFQGITFIRLAARTSASVGMTKNEVRSAMKVGAINAIGPSFGIMIVAVSLMTLLGDPLTMMRIGIIGSAATESMGASLAASAFGAGLGTEEFSREAFVAVVWVLCLGGCGWLVVTALFTKSLGKMESKVKEKGKSKGFSVMTVISSAAMLAVFSNFASAELMKGTNIAIVVGASALTMIVCTVIANAYKRMSWLNEWSLGLAIIASLTVSFYTM